MPLIPSSRSVGSQRKRLLARRRCGCWDSRFSQALLLPSPSISLQEEKSWPPWRSPGSRRLPGPQFSTGSSVPDDTCTRPPGSLWHTHTCSHADLCSLLTHIPPHHPAPATIPQRGHIHLGGYTWVPSFFDPASHCLCEGKPQQPNSSLSYFLRPELREEGSSSDAGL